MHGTPTFYLPHRSSGAVIGLAPTSHTGWSCPIVPGDLLGKEIDSGGLCMLSGIPVSGGIWGQLFGLLGSFILRAAPRRGGNGPPGYL